MGKKIDGFVLSVLAAAGLYLYFFHITGKHTAALLMAGIAFLLMAKLLKRTLALIGGSRWMQKRRFRRQAGSTLMRLACLEYESARETLAELLKKCYDCDAPLELIQAPPSASLSQERIFDLWKAHRGEEKLIICTSCTGDSACRSLSASLKQPKIALLDGNALAQLIDEHPQFQPSEQPAAKLKRRRLIQLGALLVQRRNAPRCLLFSAVMLLMYLLGGRLSNLIASMALLFLALTALRRPSRPAKLF